MSGLSLAASGETLDLTGANISYVVVVGAIALVALGFAVVFALRRSGRWWAPPVHAMDR